MDHLLLENVRCFAGTHNYPLPKITILVGENSTGKTTFLSCVRIAWDLCSRTYFTDFNEEPFLLGAFDQIANFRGGRVGRSTNFKIGFASYLEKKGKKGEPKIPGAMARIEGDFFRYGSQPTLREWIYEWGEYGMQIKYTRSKNPLIKFISPNGEFSTESIPSLQTEYELPQYANFLTFFLDTFIEKDEKDEMLPQTDMDIIEGSLGVIYKRFGRRPHAFAPIRTRPQRTYDPLKETPSPEGAHVPMILARYISSEKKKWQSLIESLHKFGEVSGLLSDIKVRRMGRKESDPFQLRVKIKGPFFNLSDVGYGISQALPLLVDTIMKPNNTTFLLQQPEVHLHPRAQAELASFLLNLSSHDKKRFIIETHSDHFVDRIRMSVRNNGLISYEDVAIIYFERDGSKVNGHVLTLDKHGNIVDPPNNYRKFFLAEEYKLISGE